MLLVDNGLVDIIMLSSWGSDRSEYVVVVTKNTHRGRCGLMFLWLACQFRTLV